MSDTVIQIENLSKSYRLGVIGGKTLAADLGRQWARFRGKPDPLSKIGASSGAATKRKNDSPSEEIWALKDVSFEVKQGEILGIIGRNGAGKSTLLKILSRVTAPTNGEVRVRGRIASLLEVGTGFHPELTGRENIFLNGAILGMTKNEIKKKFDEIVDFSEVEQFIDTPVKRYSSGMYVRLAFAVAAHLDPEILIVDEVLAVGDAAFQKKCLGKMGDVAKEGRTVLFVSHTMSTIQTLCQRCVLLGCGKVETSGIPGEVISTYLSEGRERREADIRNFPERKGSGEARLTRFEITDLSGIATEIFATGSTICFQLEFESYEPLTDPCVGVVVHAASGEPVLDLQSSHSGLRIGRADGRVRVEGTISDVGLYPGRYFLSPWITDSARRRSIDQVEMCNSVQIFEGPGQYGDLKLDTKWGKYYIASEWKVIEGSDSIVEGVN